jgi:hypothetical protein
MTSCFRTFCAAVSQSSQGSYLSSSSSGTVSSESSRNSGSFDPCDIPGLMETSESKGSTTVGMRAIVHYNAVVQSSLEMLVPMSYHP